MEPTEEPRKTVGLGDYANASEVHDKGSWEASEDGRAIESNDFTHDVILRVTGDFYSDEPSYLTEVVTKTIFKYNPKYGDERVCKCGHSYYRHFDSYDDMEPVGCGDEEE